MNKTIEIAAMLLGAVSLFAVCFLGFAMVSGAPLHEVAFIGNFFAPDKEESSSDAPVETASTQTQPVDRTDTQVVEANLGVLGAWSLPSPYSQSELRTLTDELKTRRQQLELREADLAVREADVRQELELIAERFELLESMRTNLEEFKAELLLREQEVLRTEDVASERSAARWADMARVFASLEDEEAGRRLGEFTPEEASQILLAMDAARAADLLNQVQGERWKEYVEAYTLARADSPQR